MDEASFAAAVAAVAPSTTSSSPEGFLESAMMHVVNNKQLPKYSFERSVDAFLGVFLPEIVSQLWHPSMEAELVAQEFPLEKDEGNKSTNVDYLLLACPARRNRGCSSS